MIWERCGSLKVDEDVDYADFLLPQLNPPCLDEPFFVLTVVAPFNFNGGPSSSPKCGIVDEDMDATFLPSLS